MALDSDLKNKIRDIKKCYPTSESAILPCLQVVQQKFNYIKEEHFEDLSRELSLPAQSIYAAATFYTMFNLKPVGRYHIQVCRNLSCSLLGAGSLIEHLKDKLKIEVGRTTDDGKFTLSLVECLGACGGAPVMMLNDEYHENLTALKIDEILAGCK